MILKNNWTFGGEVIRKTDFGDGKGGNVVIKGASHKGEVKLSVKLDENMFRDVCDLDYPKVVANGHIEQRMWETSGQNIKHSLRYVADKLEIMTN